MGKTYFPIFMKSRFISALELGKVMEDLGEKLSEEEVIINISTLIKLN